MQIFWNLDIWTNLASDNDDLEPSEEESSDDYSEEESYDDEDFEMN